MVGLFVLASDEFNGLPFAVIANRACAKALIVPASAQPDVTERFRAREVAMTDARRGAVAEERFHAEAMTDVRHGAAVSYRAMAKDRRVESRAAGLIRAAPVVGAEDHSVRRFPISLSPREGDSSRDGLAFSLLRSGILRSRSVERQIGAVDRSTGL